MQPLPDVHYYLPVNDDAMRWGIYLTSIGRARVGKDYSAYPPHAHPRLYNFRWETGRVLPEFAVLLISEGIGVFETKMGGATQVSGRSLIFLTPGVWHRYCPSKDVGWTERWICFNGELAHRLMDMPILQGNVPVRRVNYVAAMVKNFDELIERVKIEPSGNSILLSLHTLGLLGALIEAAEGVKLPSTTILPTRKEWAGDAITSRALAWIWTHSHQAISVNQLAEATAVTRRTLQRHFQESVGHSIMEEIIHCRVNRAKRLLEETDMPMKAIAYLAGFPSVQRMRVAFTQREQVSPTVFRRRARRSLLEFLV